jgi:uncharacterized protein YecE (DUF72 family)
MHHRFAKDQLTGVLQSKSDGRIIHTSKDIENSLTIGLDCLPCAMEFGHLSDDELAAIDYTLAPDAPFTLETLASAGKSDAFKIHIGLSKWQDKTWMGKLFPKGTDPKEFLAIYARNFDTVEFNASFYNIYSRDELAKWNVQVEAQPNFTFCPKFPQTITHIRRLKNAGEATDKFYEGLKGMAGHLGPAFIQMGDNFTHKNFDDLKSYVFGLPKAPKVFLEIRHKDWFADPDKRYQLFNTLREAGIGTVITDAAGRRDCVHMELTRPEVMIRFVANSRHPTGWTSGPTG